MVLYTGVLRHVVLLAVLLTPFARYNVTQSIQRWMLVALLCTRWWARALDPCAGAWVPSGVLQKGNQAQRGGCKAY